MKRLAKWLVCAFAIALSPCAHAIDFEFHAPADASDPNLAAAVRDLAERILPVYHDDNPERYLSSLSALQLVSGHYAAADGTRETLRERHRESHDRKARPDARAVLVDLYAHARALEADERVPLAQAFGRAFAETVPKLRDADAYGVTAWSGVQPGSLQKGLQQALDRVRGHDRVEQSDALRVVWAYLAFDLSRSVGPQLAKLGADDERRRYIIEESATIKTAGNVTLHARVVRPKSGGRLPTLLEFASATSTNDAKASAAHGYVGLIVDPREKRIVTAGEGARAVRAWLSRQSWSDHGIALFGRGDDAFVAWQAAGRRPRAFKAIVTEDAAAPPTPRIPSDKQFAALKIPVLAMTGDCGDADAGTLHYFRQHTRYNPQADHTLLLGACDTAALLDESVAATGLDLRELRYQWLDHAFKGTPVPALLQGRVNYEDKNTHEWRHAESLPE